MSKPRIHILALGGTIATQPDASGAMQMGLGRRTSLPPCRVWRRSPR
jgi:L-asparaginase/Glu-tRNA(Gln) amidotransferase subunit D